MRIIGFNESHHGVAIGGSFRVVAAILGGGYDVALVFNGTSSKKGFPMRFTSFVREGRREG